MPHTITYNSDLRIIEAKFQGSMTLNELKEYFSEFAQVTKAQHCFLSLADLREATLTLSTLEIYGLPKILADIFGSAGISAFDLRRALVVVTNLEDFSFLETVAYNRSHKLKCFEDIDLAKKWLLDK